MLENQQTMKYERKVTPAERFFLHARLSQLLLWWLESKSKNNFINLRY
jgi:hypothetical protein